MGTRVVDGRQRTCHPQTTLSATIRLKAQQPCERRRSRVDVGTKCRAIQVLQHLLFLLLVRLCNDPMCHGVNLDFFILVSTACTTCVLRYVPEESEG